MLAAEHGCEAAIAKPSGRLQAHAVALAAAVLALVLALAAASLELVAAEKQAWTGVATDAAVVLPVAAYVLVSPAAHFPTTYIRGTFQELK